MVATLKVRLKYTTQVTRLAWYFQMHQVQTLNQNNDYSVAGFQVKTCIIFNYVLKLVKLEYNKVKNEKSSQTTYF